MQPEQTDNYWNPCCLLTSQQNNETQFSTGIVSSDMFKFTLTSIPNKFCKNINILYVPMSAKNVLNTVVFLLSTNTSAVKNFSVHGTGDEYRKCKTVS